MDASATVTVFESLSLPPGGSQTSADGLLSFELPGSVTNSLTITYTPQISLTNGPGDLIFAGLSFHLDAVDGSGATVVAPEAPVSMTLHYDESALPAGTMEANLQILRYDPDGGAWVALEVLDRDTQANTLTVLLDHFSEFGLFEVEPVEPEPQFNVFLPLVNNLN